MAFACIFFSGMGVRKRQRSNPPEAFCEQRSGQHPLLFDLRHYSRCDCSIWSGAFRNLAVYRFCGSGYGSRVDWRPSFRVALQRKMVGLFSCKMEPGRLYLPSDLFAVGIFGICYPEMGESYSGNGLSSHASQSGKDSDLDAACRAVCRYSGFNLIRY